MPDWTVRAQYSTSEPYYTFGIAATFLPWLEVTGRLVGISGMPALSENYGDAKDKAIDIKIRLLEEKSIWPELAVGANDIHGTGLFSSRYLVVSKILGPIDMTIGVGQGILAGDITRGTGSSGDASDDAAFTFLTSSLNRSTRVFGGVELLLTKDLSVMAEYSPIDYEKLFGNSEPADIPFNFGLKFRLLQNSYLSASYLRGEHFGWSFGADFPLKPEGLLPWKKQPFWSPSESLKQKAMKAPNNKLALLIRDEVSAEGFSNVRAAVSDMSVWLEIENPSYLSNNKALGRSLRVVSNLAPPRIQWIYISLKAKDIILLTIKMAREDFEAFIDNRLESSVLLQFTQMSMEGNELRADFLNNEIGASTLTDIAGTKKYVWGIKPSWQTLLNDPSGFIKHKFSLAWKAAYFPWPGAVMSARVRTPIFNNISSSNETQETDAAVRTDFMNYYGDTNVRLEKLAFDQVFDLPEQFLARAEIGYFESAYAGVGGEVFRFFQEGRWGFGLESEVVKKRDIDDSFKMLSGSPTYKTFFLNMYHNLVPDLGLDVGLKLGRFLAGDWGGRLDVSRTFNHFTLGFWYTITDTSVFTSTPNIGYHDKGVYFTVPYSIFTDKDVPAKLYYGIRPWTRDPGQTVTQINSLYPMGNIGNASEFRRKIEELKH